MPKNSQDVVITYACRTGIGKYIGMWDKVQAHDLGKLVIKDILKQTSIKPDKIDEVILGQVLTSNTGQNPARQAAKTAGIPDDKVSYVVLLLCDPVLSKEQLQKTNQRLHSSPLLHVP